MHMHSSGVLAALTEIWIENYSKTSTLLKNPILRNFLNCAETAKGRRLKLCHFSEQLSENIFVKALFLYPLETRLLAAIHDLLP